MSRIKLFESAEIRSIWSEDAQLWYFSIVDVVQVLTDSVNPPDYLKKLRKHDTELDSYLGFRRRPALRLNLLSVVGRFGRAQCRGAQRAAALARATSALSCSAGVREGPRWRWPLCAGAPAARCGAVRSDRDRWWPG